MSKLKIDMNQLKQEEHEKYFFGICSTEVYYTLEESIKRCITDFMEQIEETLIEENVSTKERIEKEVAEIKALYMRKCMEVLEDFKNSLRDIFKIPENAAIYPKSEKKSYTEDEIRILREEVALLEQSFLREDLFLVHLKREKEILESLRPIFVDSKMVLADLKNETYSNEVHKLKETHKKNREHIKYSNHDVGIDQSPELEKDLGISF